MRNTKTFAILFIAAASVLLSTQARADDTELFGGVVNIPPNVLIIFDNSGSMDETVEVIHNSTPYDPSTVYSGPYRRDRVYRFRTTYRDWVSLVNIGSNYYVDESEINCEATRVALNTKGTWSGYINNNAPYRCTPVTTSWTLRTGNYLNYLQTGTVEYRRKIDIAKDTIANIIHTTEGVRFGVMIFNNNEGGRILAPIATRESSTAKEALIAQIRALSPTTWTPLAETLAEAGLYYARKQSWFNSGVDYATAYDPAIQYRCQKNYIIIMTDGESTQDRNSKLWATTYLNGKVIGDYDQDSAIHDEYHWVSSTGALIAYADYGSDYLDDVAKFLHDEDLLGDIPDQAGMSFNEQGFEKQNIEIYTIGFAIDHKLLSETADKTHGNGKYFTTTGSLNLEDIFVSIIANILERNTQFVSPVVPVNRMNRTYADNAIYLGLFSPDSEHPGLWKGNLKKFGLSDTGEILDKYGNAAASSTGAVLESAHSAWCDLGSGEKEGMDVEAGGAGQKLIDQSSRVFKTNLGSSLALVDLNSTNVLPSHLGVTTDAERDELLDFVKGQGKFHPKTGDDVWKRDWILGDIIHSQPTILYDRDRNRNVIFVGANDGFLHCFIDSDRGTPSLLDDEVREAWAYVPGDLLKNLKYLPSDNMTSAGTLGDTYHDYFVDGSPVLYKSGGSRYLAFGLRRGGKDLQTGGELDNQYFILRLNASDDNVTPTLVARIAKDILGSNPDDEKLGQSWCTPVFATIKTGPAESNRQDVLLLTGGYDTNQDGDDPGGSDSKGRAVFAVGAASGALVSSLNFNHKNFPQMRYSMVDLMAYDNDDDGCTDVIYAPSVGGDLFLFDDAHQNLGSVNDGTWTRRLLFRSNSMGGTSRLRKFMYAPAIVQETWGDWVYIASGDREHPSDPTGSGYGGYNRIYAIRNTFPSTWNNDSPFTDGDLSDVSADELQGTVSSPSTLSEEQKMTLRYQLANTGNGWFFDLERPGEKAVSSPVVYKGVVYFTTYTPGRPSTEEDPCGTTGGGIARIYAVDYRTGEAVFATFDGNAAKLTKEDRYKDVGSGIPSEPVVIVTKAGTYVLVSTEEGTQPIKTGDPVGLNRYYWLKRVD
ncbi:MAG TPA: PilC/PilY family type IV pilus protein [Deltaproteobacteria bacterium]|nr:PilC/PilY family type IV pilus protein [Deltaproteobacteria bacterium]HPP80258.1 PilC/PilY family type IV pilus protein [Deltaproteobacteria bacterium]